MKPGFGSVSPDVYMREFPELAAAINAEIMHVRPRCVPLADVEEACRHADARNERIVLIP